MGWNAVDTNLRDKVGSESERIWVGIRIRPLSERELQAGQKLCWKAASQNIVEQVVDSQLRKGTYNKNVNETSVTRTYADRVFSDREDSHAVYLEAAQGIVKSGMEGINGTVFAYGQTGSGKTFTMHTVVQYATQEIFEFIKSSYNREFLIRISAFEIYNEVVYDLLSAKRIPLRLLDDPERGTVAEGLTENPIVSIEDLTSNVLAVEKRRQVGETEYNALSSRSHQIIRLTIESRPLPQALLEEDSVEGNLQTPADDFEIESASEISAPVRLSTLNFVDLAGSESHQDQRPNSRQREGSHINQSLLALGKVIRALGDSAGALVPQGPIGGGGGGTTPRNGGGAPPSPHVPYRDSKLTRMLQHSLGGNARTAVMCTVSPTAVDQTRSTLHFASQAKLVTNHAQVNEVFSSQALLQRYQREIRDLKLRLASASASVAAAAAAGSQALQGPDAEDLNKLKQQERHIKEMESVMAAEVEARRAVERRLKNLQSFILKSGPHAGEGKEESSGIFPHAVILGRGVRTPRKAPATPWASWDPSMSHRGQEDEENEENEEGGEMNPRSRAVAFLSSLQLPGGKEGGGGGGDRVRGQQQGQRVLSNALFEAEGQEDDDDAEELVTSPLRGCGTEKLLLRHFRRTRGGGGGDRHPSAVTGGLTRGKSDSFVTNNITKEQEEEEDGKERSGGDASNLVGGAEWGLERRGASELAEARAALQAEMTCWAVLRQHQDRLQHQHQDQDNIKSHHLGGQTGGDGDDVLLEDGRVDDPSIEDLIGGVAHDVIPELPLKLLQNEESEKERLIAQLEEELVRLQEEVVFGEFMEITQQEEIEMLRAELRRRKDALRLDTEANRAVDLLETRLREMHSCFPGVGGLEEFLVDEPEDSVRLHSDGSESPGGAMYSREDMGIVHGSTTQDGRKEEEEIHEEEDEEERRFISPGSSSAVLFGSTADSPDGLVQGPRVETRVSPMLELPLPGSDASPNFSEKVNRTSTLFPSGGSLGAGEGVRARKVLGEIQLQPWRSLGQNEGQLLRSIQQEEAREVLLGFKEDDTQNQADNTAPPQMTASLELREGWRIRLAGKEDQEEECLAEGDEENFFSPPSVQVNLSELVGKRAPKEVSVSLSELAGLKKNADEKSSGKLEVARPASLVLPNEEEKEKKGVEEEDPIKKEARRRARRKEEFERKMKKVMRMKVVCGEAVEAGLADVRGAVLEYRETIDKLECQKQLLINQVLKLEVEQDEIGEKYDRLRQLAERQRKAVKSRNRRIDQLEADRKDRMAEVTAKDANSADQAPQLSPRVVVDDAKMNTKQMLASIQSLWVTLKIPLLHRCSFMQSFARGEGFFFEAEHRRLKWMYEREVVEANALSQKVPSSRWRVLLGLSPTGGSVPSHATSAPMAKRELELRKEREKLYGALRKISVKEKAKIYEDYGVDSNAKLRKKQLVERIYNVIDSAQHGIWPTKCATLILRLHGAEKKDSDEKLNMIFSLVGISS